MEKIQIILKKSRIILKKSRIIWENPENSGKFRNKTSE
jgi:hypothetical protein